MNHMTPEEILDQMEELFPDAHCELNHRNAYELLVAVVLSAQTTDASVNRVTPALFARFPTPQDMAAADEEEIGSYIRSIGLYRSKARSLRALSASLCEQFDGVVPSTYIELMSLAGVGRKTANLILGDVFHTPGVVVADTHCIRISGRLGLTDGTKDPGKVEKQLREILPPEESNDFCHRLVLHGRAICTARQAKCGMCPLAPVCDYAAKL